MKIGFLKSLYPQRTKTEKLLENLYFTSNKNKKYKVPKLKFETANC
jgi:hypothetical protein